MITAGIAMATLGLIAERAEAGNLKLYQPTGNDAQGQYVETNIFSDVKPLGVNHFTFLDHYANGGYFGKSMFTKPIAEGLSAKVQAVHANDVASQTRWGFEYSVPNMPEGTCANVAFLPVSANGDGRVEDSSMLEYFTSVDLPHNATLSSFGGWNVAAEGTPWTYGQVDLTVPVSDSVSAGLRLALIGDGDSIPKAEPRVTAQLNF